MHSRHSVLQTLPIKCKSNRAALLNCTRHWQYAHVTVDGNPLHHLLAHSSTLAQDARNGSNTLPEQVRGVQHSGDFR
jgi:hypothetical protein